MPLYMNPEDAPNELQRVLLHAVPANIHGNKTVGAVAEALGVSRWAVQKWIIQQKLTPQRAVQIVDMSEGRVSLADLSRFVYKF